jgi:hypothetical protein
MEVKEILGILSAPLLRHERIEKGSPDDESGRRPGLFDS